MKTCHVKNIVIGEGMPKICIPLVSNTIEGILEEIAGIKNHPVDLVEWRMDTFSAVPHLDKVLHGLEKIRTALLDIPLLCTFRTIQEGGKTKLSPAMYVSLLTTIISSGYADLIDIELSQGVTIIRPLIALAKQHHVKVILSNHVFQKTPTQEEIIERLLSMQTLGADIAKIAAMPNHQKDVLTLLQATIVMSQEKASIPIVTMSMGHLGAISRMVGESFGSSITFGSVKEVSAPGQIPVDELFTILTTLHTT